MQLLSLDSKLPEESQQAGCSPKQSPNQANLYTPTKLCTSLETAKEVAASYVLSSLNIDLNNDANNNVQQLYVTNDVTTSVAALSMEGGSAKGYPSIPSIFTNSDPGFAGYSLYNGVYPAAGEGYSGPF